jgi:hypothetical protein
MNTLTTAFANVQWVWVLEAGLALSCVRFILLRPTKLTKPGLLIDLCVTVALATISVFYLVRTDAAAGAKEVILAISLGYLVESAITPFWKWRKPEETNPAAVEAP